MVRQWRRLRGQDHRLEHRIVHLVVILLVAIQLASFLCMRYVIDQAAQRSLHDELQVGGRVLDRLLLHQGQRLQEAAEALSADFALREAAATQDQKTIVSALVNHAARYRSSRLILVGLDGTVVADSADSKASARPFPYPELMQSNAGIERGPSIRTLDGKPHQVVVIPVKTPFTIAWLALSLPVDDAMANDLARLVNAGVAFVVQEASNARVVATTLSEATQKGIIGPLLSMVRQERGEGKIEGMGASYQVLVRRLDESTGPRISAILLRSTEEALLPYRVLEVVALLLTAAAIALTLYGSILIARRISRPLAKLEAYGQQERSLMRARYGRVREQRDDLSRLTKALASEATRDSLTGLANRRTLELHLAGWDAEARTTAALMVDVDQLKDINERHSWAIGDRVLQVVAEIARSACRPADLAARYQGDALVLVIADPDAGAAAAIATRIARSVGSHRWQDIAPGLGVTVSIGIANPKKGVEPSAAVRSADKALHEAKRAGPSQVRSATGTFVAV